MILASNSQLETSQSPYFRFLATTHNYIFTVTLHDREKHKRGSLLYKINFQKRPYSIKLFQIM